MIEKHIFRLNYC